MQHARYASDNLSHNEISQKPIQAFTSFRGNFQPIENLLVEEFVIDIKPKRVIELFLEVVASMRISAHDSHRRNFIYFRNYS